MAKMSEAAFKIFGVLIAVLGFVLLVQPQSFSSAPSVSTAISGIIIMAMGGFLFVMSEK